MAEVTIRNLEKRFGTFLAVNDATIEIGDGEFVFLLGPSGCGKTTTLRMIAGLEMPTGGEIRIGGRNVTYLRPRYRNVGMVFQDYGLYRHFTVFENIAYPLRVRRMGEAEIRSKVGAVAETLQISAVLRRKPDHLSGGQLQRVAIARMLVRDADVFLMDEPMSHLDAQLRGLMRAELKHIQKKIGVTTVFVTHDQLEAMTMADRIIVMKDGRMLQFATPQEIFERPANEFVATFVGEPQMNILDAAVTVAEGRVWIAGAAFRIEAPAAWGRSANLGALAGRRLRLGVRPEHVRISGEAGADTPLPATLFAFEPTGAENLYTLNLGADLVTSRASTTGTALVGKADGSPVRIGFDPNWLYLFDAETGDTLAHAAGSAAGRTGGQA